MESIAGYRRHSAAPASSGERRTGIPGHLASCFYCFVFGIAAAPTFVALFGISSALFFSLSLSLSLFCLAVMRVGWLGQIPRTFTDGKVVAPSDTFLPKRHSLERQPTEQVSETRFSPTLAVR